MPGSQRTAQQLSAVPSRAPLVLVPPSTLLQHSKLQTQLCSGTLSCQQAAHCPAHEQATGAAICPRASEKHGVACMKVGAQLG